MKASSGGTADLQARRHDSIEAKSRFFEELTLSYNAALTGLSEAESVRFIALVIRIFNH